MKSFLLTYIISYFLTYTGFLLGKATVEEHHEIHDYVRAGVELLTLATYVIVYYHFREHFLAILVFVLLLGFKLVSLRYPILARPHNIALFGLTMVFFNKYWGEEIYFALLPMLILMFDKSFVKFEFMREIYYFILAVVILVLFNI